MAAKIITNACKKGADAQTMKQIAGKEWVRETRKVMAEIQAKPEYAQVKRL